MIRRKPSTRDLLHGEHRLQTQRQRRRGLRALAILLLALLVTAPGLYYNSRLVAQNEQLQALQAQQSEAESQLQESQLQLRMSRASEQQLSQRNADLTAQIEQLNTELAFFRQQKKRP